MPRMTDNRAGTGTWTQNRARPRALGCRARSGCSGEDGCAVAYPAHVLALGAWGEGLGADNGAPSKKRPRGGRAHPPVLGPHHRGRWGWGLCVGLLVHLRRKGWP